MILLKQQNCALKHFITSELHYSHMSVTHQISSPSVLYDFLVTLKAAPQEYEIRTGHPKT